MTGRAKLLIIGTLVGLGSAEILAHAQEDSRVRTSNPTLASLIREGAEGSPTFGRLLRTIESSDGLVHITVGRCGRLRACLLHRLTMAGSYRVLTIRVDPERHDVGLAAAIAHELQHAAEVLGDASITTDAAMFAFYWTSGLKMVSGKPAPL
jgi:hypothetical protein